MSGLDNVNDPERLRDLVDAVLTIGSDLSLPRVLRSIVEAAVRVVDCRYGALGVISEHGDGLSEFVQVGVDPDAARAIGPRPSGRGILGRLIVEPRPLRLEVLSRHADSFGFPPNHPPMSTFLGVPIRVRDQVFGNLYLTEKSEGGTFSADDEELAVALAGAAGVAIEKARLHARVRDLTLVEDRERIAADLHDTVIQRLFATGLALQATLKVISPPEAAARVDAAVTDLDETIRQIRSTIFALEAPRVAGRGLRDEVLSLVGQAAASLGFEPHLRLDGPLDTTVDQETARHLLAVLREALSNVVRHARASRVDVAVGVADGQVSVEVVDDGAGMPATTRPGGRGLLNMQQRAQSLGGAATVGAGPGGSGTRLGWHVPLSGD